MTNVKMSLTLINYSTADGVATATTRFNKSRAIWISG